MSSTRRDDAIVGKLNGFNAGLLQASSTFADLLAPALPQVSPAAEACRNLRIFSRSCGRQGCKRDEHHEFGCLGKMTKLQVDTFTPPQGCSLGSGVRATLHTRFSMNMYELHHYFVDAGSCPDHGSSIF